MKRRGMKYWGCVMSLCVISYAGTADASALVSVTIDSDVEKWSISRYLVGAHTVYYNDRDAAYDDDGLALWCKQAGVATMRYPGGTVVKYWDWETPSGTNKGDPWEPGYVDPNTDENNYMSMDEYLHFCDVSGITPLVGVNYRSGAVYNRQQDSIDRAVRQVEYVALTRGYTNAFWYIGNEDLNALGGVQSAGESIIEHAAAMKAVDPTLKVFWNDNGVNYVSITNWLNVMHPDQIKYPGRLGDYADGVEYHSKWPYQGAAQPNLDRSYSDWLTIKPLGWQGTKPMRQAAAEAGYPDLLLADNEYGWGGKCITPGFNKFTMGLVQMELLQELFIYGYDMSCFWANIRGADKSLLDRDNNYRRNPQTLGWELLAAAQGATMVESASSHRFVYGFSAKTATNMYVYLLNKTETNQLIEVTFSSSKPQDPMAATGLSAVDTPDHYGTNQSLTVTYNSASNAWYATLPALSYSRIDFGVVPVHNIIATKNIGGSIFPSGTMNVIEGTNVSFTIAANISFEISDVTVDGSSIGAVTNYTFTNVVADHTINVTFASPGPRAILLDHVFDGGANDLNGTSLDVNSIDASTWNASPEVTADGVMVLPVFNTRKNCNIDLGAGTITMGSADDVYELDIVVDGQMTGNSHLSGGFWKNNPSSNHDYGGSPYFMWNSSLGDLMARTGNELPVDNDIFYGNDYLSPTGGYETFTLKMDLTDADLTNNSASFYLGTNLLGSAGFDGNEGFRYVGIGGRNLHNDTNYPGAIATVQRITFKRVNATAPAVTTNHSIPYTWLQTQNTSWTNDYEAAATDDPDGDGYSTAQEYWSGTDPLNSNSVFKIKSVALNGSNVRLIWEHSHVDPAIPPIAIHRRFSLSTGDWEYVDEKIPSDGTNSWEGELFPKVFYRLVGPEMP